APRGAATLAGVLSYAGKPFPVWERGAWRTRHGWQDIRKVDLGPLGRRLSAVCDVPDLALFPDRYSGVADVRFRAALEVGAQHLAIALLAACRRAGWKFAGERFASHLDGMATWFDRFGGETGGMTVTLSGQARNGTPLKLRWHVLAPGNYGPEIPCMAAILLARRLAAGTVNQVGAMPCMGLIALDEFAPEFSKWGMHTGIEELS
ncbi:MAG: saccharopine dehydrogenase, partial [Betaproteobacteria bacterium]